jgi:hypothetical protein
MACASAAEKNTGKAKVTALKDQKDPKEKRDAPASAPYSYETPQKTFHSPAVHVQPPQPKHTHVEHYTQQHKVAPLEYAKQEAPQHHHHQQQQQQHEQYHPTSFVAPAQPVENLYAQPIKELEDYSLSYPHYESFNQFPGIYGEYDKLIAFPVKPVSNLKTMPYYQPAQAYSYPQPSYPMTSQHSYPMSYAASIPAHYTSSFSQSPAALFVPQTVSIAPKPHGKIPDYAQGSKGLSHFSTFSSIQPVSASYTNKPSYDVPSYIFTPTERPFKPSPFLGASVVPSEPYRYEKVEYAPSKTYLPAKEQYGVPMKEQYGVPLKEQYGVPVKEQYQNYLPQKEQYATALKEQYVTPLKEQYQSYAPQKEQYYTQQVPKEYYQQYAPQAAPINYEIQYVQYPAGKSYLPPAAPINSYPSTPIHSYPQAASPPTSSYLPPAKIEAPKNSYLPPPAAPTKTYLPAKVEKPKNNYLPPQPTQSNTYLPPNNPFSSHQQSSQEVYDSSEYYSGHK